MEGKIGSVRERTEVPSPSSHSSSYVSNYEYIKKSKKKRPKTVKDLEGPRDSRDT